MRLSLDIIELVKKREKTSTIFSTFFDLKNESQIQPELGDSQQVTKQVTAKLGVNSKKTTDDPDKSRTTGGEQVSRRSESIVSRYS